MTPTPPASGDEPPGYSGRIRRGPMAADAFTQIRNALFRDSRLSFRDKGIFGLISTHREGFGVSAESIAACSPTDGVSAVKSSLRNLEKYGYLRRTRLRKKDGTLGGAMYFITDQPEDIDASGAENPRSEPAVPEPTLAEPALVQPTVAEPTVAESTHKNTNSKNTSGKKTLSPPAAPHSAAAAGPGQGERETPASPNDKPTTAQRVIRAAAVLTPADDEQAFIDWVTATHAPRGPGWWRTTAANGDLPDLVAAWRAVRPAGVVEGAAGVPEWCGECNDGDSLAAVDVTLRLVEGGDGRYRRCDCHPRAAPAVVGAVA